MESELPFVHTVPLVQVSDSVTTPKRIDLLLWPVCDIIHLVLIRFTDGSWPSCYHAGHSNGWRKAFLRFCGIHLKQFAHNWYPAVNARVYAPMSPPYKLLYTYIYKWYRYIHIHIHIDIRKHICPYAYTHVLETISKMLTCTPVSVIAAINLKSSFVLYLAKGKTITRLFQIPVIICYNGYRNTLGRYIGFLYI